MSVIIEENLSADLSLQKAFSMNIKSYFKGYENDIDPEKVKIQRKSIEDAIAKGANLEKAVGDYVSYELLTNHLNIFQTHLSPDGFLKVVLNISVNGYYLDGEYVNDVDPKKMEIKGKLIENAIAKGANLEKASNGYVSPEVFINHINIFQAYLCPQKYLSKVLSMNINGYYLDGEYIKDIDPEKVELQRKLIEDAIAKGANLEKASGSYISFELFTNHVNIFQKNLSPNDFLGKVLSMSVSGYYLDGKYINDVVPKKVELQRKLIEDAIAKGANLEKALSRYIGYDLLKSHANMFQVYLSPQDFLSKVLKIYLNGYSLDGKYINDIDPEKVALQRKLIEDAIAKGANLEKASSDYVSSEVFINQANIFQVYLSPQDFFNKVLSIYVDENNSKLVDIQSKSIEDAISKGADVNYNLEGDSALEIVNSLEIKTLLKNHDAKCLNSDMQEFYEGGIGDLFFKPSFAIEQKYKNLYAPKADAPKMPHLLHHIWLTHPSSPREIRPQDLKIVEDNHKLFANSSSTWQHIVWVNDQSLIPASVKALQEMGVSVQSIYEHQSILSSFDVIDSMISKQKWGMASDALRYSLIEEFGGVYADLNFIFARDVTEETYKYNFFSKTFGSYYVDNFFFGATAHHPVVEKTVELVNRNLVNPPKYISDISNQNSPIITDLATANPTFVAYYKNANKNGNIDVVYPLTEEDYFVSLPKHNAEEKGVNEEMISRAVEEAVKPQELLVNQLKLFCPEKTPFMDFFDIHNSYELCGSSQFNVGHDSTDGRTWV